MPTEQIGEEIGVLQRPPDKPGVIKTGAWAAVADRGASRWASC
jgi:hypothetical protein